MGRKAKPTQLKLVTGNPGHKRLNKNEPKMKPGIPEAPPELSGEALIEWDRVAVPLYNLGVLTKFDRAILSLYCQAWGRWVEAERIVAKTGLTITTASGNIIQNPVLGAANKAARDCAKYASELGLTPSARTRIDTEGLNARAASQKDEIEEFFG